MSILVRPAVQADLSAVAPLAAKLVRLHRDFDPQRFMLLENVEAGYAQFFASQLRRKQAVILVAEVSERISGYAYGALEERDWNALLDRAGALHDIYVDEGARRKGVARELLTAMLARLEALGAPRVVLHTAWVNEGAHRFFEAAGFRRTMIEMTREAGG